MLAQILLDYLRGKTQKRKEEAEINATVRVIRFHFYAAEHVLKESLETGFWWSGEAGLDVAAAGEELGRLAGLLTEDQWRIYTGAWRRLRGCIQRYDECILRPGRNGLSAKMAEHAYGHNLISQRIEPADLKFLLSTFITVDDARLRLLPYVREKETREVPLRKALSNDARNPRGSR